MKRTLRFETSSTTKKAIRDWWEWEVRLVEKPEVLGEIDHVEYVLHPTFPDRIRTVRTPSDGFALRSAGWGGFDLVANIHFKNGEEQTQIVTLELGAK